MNLDATRLPLVFIRAEATSDLTYEQQLDAVLDRETPFVFISEAMPNHDHDETPEARKDRALQFKRQRDRLRRLCRGVVVIEGEKPLSLAYRLASEGFGKAVGVSVRFAASEADAIAAGEGLLAV